LVETLHARIARPGTAIALTAIIIAVALVLAGLLVWQNYRLALTAGDTKAQSAADIVAAHMDWMVEASDQALRRIDTAIGDRPLGTVKDVVSDISEAVGDLPQGFQYSVYDAAGVLRLSSVSRAGSIRIDDRDYFKQLKAGMPLVISPRLTERLTDRPVFIIARSIMRKGQFHGVASIAIPVQKIDEFWNAIGLGAHSTVSVLLADGWVVARHPDLRQPLNIAGATVFKMLPKSPHGTYYSPVSPADGMARVVGYRKIEHWPLIAIAGMDIDEVLDMFWHSLELQLAFGLPALILLVGFAVWIAWLLRAFAVRNLELEEAVERNHALFREIHHRVKNNLQAVSSLIRLQPLPDEVRSDMARRIAAMVAVHEHIYQQDQFERVSLAPYVERLVGEIARSYPQEVEIDTQLAPMTVDRDLVLPIGMIVNEVVSNAFKYAFHGRAAGRLGVTLAESGGEATLKIADNGPGLSDDGKKGMGSRLIAGFVGQIGGRYQIDSNDSGVTFILVFPLRLGEERERGAALDAA
jgi:two-component sensor histidine kinase